MPSLADFDLSQLEHHLHSQSFPPTHAERILRNYYQSAGQITLTPNQIGHRLHHHLTHLTPSTKILLRQQSTDGTIKLLLQLPTNNYSIESVLIPSHRPDRAAACVSSQVGCPMACDFCASTKSGLERNLTSGEIVEQFLHLRREAQALGRRIQTVVLMGMGEPLLNYDNTIAAIKRIADPQVGAVGWRQITLSTVGIIPGIERLTREDLRIQLAVSLHAPDDATRSTIIPAARKYPINEILHAAQTYQRSSRRPVNIEYTLLQNVNDSPHHARVLAQLLTGTRMHVNLIPYNPIGPGLSGRTYHPPSQETIEQFAQILQQNNIPTHTRQPKGQDINGACGQLRQKESGAQRGLSNSSMGVPSALMFHAPIGR